MRLIVVRKVLVLLLIACGLGAWAQDQPAMPAPPATPPPAVQGALLSGRGAVTVNGQPSRSSQALLPGDLIVTPADGGANLTLDGTSILLTGAVAARFEGAGITLERGALSAGTQKGFLVRTGCLTIAPVDPNQWTEFAVTDSENATVTVLVRKGAVNITEADKIDRLEAGREATRPSCLAEQREKEKRRRTGAATAASTGPLNSNIAVIGGAAGAGALTIFILTRPPAPYSPSKP